VNLSEILVIVVVALIVFGPERLPAIARRSGQWWRQWQHLKNQLDQQVETQMNHYRLSENEAKAQEADQTYLEGPRVD